MLYKKLLSILLLLSALGGQALASKAAYFVFTDGAGGKFVIKLTDAAKIKAARASEHEYLSGKKDGYKHVMGTINTKSGVSYNPGWDYYLEPGSIRFVEVSTSVCNHTIGKVEKMVKDKVVDEYLPGKTWCPHQSRIIAEVSR
jgi:hypothetical protein